MSDEQQQTAREWTVCVYEELEHRVTVTASTKDEAETEAIELVVQDSDKHFFGVTEREAYARETPL